MPTFSYFFVYLLICTDLQQNFLLFNHTFYENINNKDSKTLETHPKQLIFQDCNIYDNSVAKVL